MPTDQPLTQQDIATFYGDHHSWLFGWLHKRLGCSHHASDIAQDTFLRIISSRDALFGLREPRAFLTTTAKRLIIDEARRYQVEQTYLSELAARSDLQTGFPSPEEISIAVQALEEISAALYGLSPKAQEAFILHYLEEKTHSEIASHLGVSTKMVQKYLAQALIRCQQTAL